MRRVVLILLALSLMPSLAGASWYRCAYGSLARMACCCPTRAHPPRHRPAPQGPSLGAASCCTVTHVTSTAAPQARVDDPVSIDLRPLVTTVAFARVPELGRVAIAAVDRPRAQGDPPDTLFARRCSLLL